MPLVLTVKAKTWVTPPNNAEGATNLADLYCCCYCFCVLLYFKSGKMEVWRFLFFLSLNQQGSKELSMTWGMMECKGAAPSTWTLFVERSNPPIIADMASVPQPAAGCCRVAHTLILQEGVQLTNFAEGWGFTVQQGVTQCDFRSQLFCPFFRCWVCSSLTQVTFRSTPAFHTVFSFLCSNGIRKWIQMENNMM